MSRYTLLAGAAALVLAAGPAFAQGSSAPAQGAVQPHHATHPAPAHKLAAKGVGKPTSPDMSADQLNAKELASIQHQQATGTMAPSSAAPAKPAKP
jgi:hypothetical protein